MSKIDADTIVRAILHLEKVAPKKGWSSHTVAAFCAYLRELMKGDQ